MAQQDINLGTTANDGKGDKLNIAIAKVQANFNDLYDNKENKLSIGGASQYLNGEKTWQDLNINAVVGLQTALDGKVAKGGITTSGLTTNTGILLGRKSTGSGAIENLDSLEVKTLLGLDNVSNTSDANKPISIAAASALAAKQDSLPAGTNSQFLRGDKTFVAITKSDVGLNAVDNTSDGSKPVFQATVNGIVPAPGTTAYNAGDKFLASNGTWVSAAQAAGGVTSVAGKTGVVTLVKGDVGLANVDNTSDLLKPVSTATQNALDTKAPLSHTHVIADVTGLTAALAGKEPTVSPAATNPATQYYRGDKTWQTLDKGSVGLDKVDNTSDLLKPLSTATQTALDGKANATDINNFVKFYMAGNLEAGDVVGHGFAFVVANSVARAMVASTSAVVFDVLKNGAKITTVSFAAGQTVGTFGTVSNVARTLATGDIIELVPSTGASDATLDKVAIVLHS